MPLQIWVMVHLNIFFQWGLLYCSQKKTVISIFSNFVFGLSRHTKFHMHVWKDEDSFHLHRWKVSVSDGESTAGSPVKNRACVSGNFYIYQIDITAWVRYNAKKKDTAWKWEQCWRWITSDSSHACSLYMCLKMLLKRLDVCENLRYFIS